MADTASAQLKRVLALIPRLADDEEHSLDEVAAAASGEIRIHHIDPNRPRGRTKTTRR